MNIKKPLSIIALAISISPYVTAQDFKQQVDHKIAVQLNDVAHTLSGKITTAYKNNSKDTLSYIYYHLYPNAYKNNQTAFAKQYLADGNVDFHFNKEEDRGYIDSLKFTVNGQFASVEQTANIDVVKVLLPKPLAPGATATIHTPFFVKLPLVYSRLGHEGQEYQISQWFPKPAVYDKNGWNAFPYLNLGEYYSDFGSYEVAISLPKNYVVLGTGEIQEESETQYLERLAQSTAIPYKGLKAPEKVSSQEYKTVTFKEENVHDFAWFASKSWKIKIQELSAGKSGKKVKAYLAYNPAHETGWKDGMSYIQNTLDTYGVHVGEYPYSTVKAVEGALKAGGGMEYPTVTVIQQSNDPSFVEQVIVHEVGHNWFYGILANNERTSPWLDESINSFYERKAVKPSSNVMGGLMASLEKATTQAFAAYHSMQPLCTHSAHFTNMNYGNDLYQKGPDYIAYLEAYMGEEAFKKGMNAYFDKYKFTHVDAQKLKATLEQHTDKSLDWFFNDLIKKSETVDFSIQKVDNGFKVNNKTSYEAPVGIETTQEADKRSKSALELVPARASRIFHSEATSGSINSNVPDYNTNNNVSNEKGLKLNGIIPLHPQAGHNIALAPALGYNYNNGFMLGAMLHNVGIPQQKLEFILAPMYGFKSQSLAGTAYLGYNQYSDGLFKHVKYSVNLKRYAYDRYEVVNKAYPHYLAIKPEIYIDFKQSSARSTKQHSLVLRGHFINEQLGTFSLHNNTPGEYNVSLDHNRTRSYVTVDYLFENSVTLNPYSVRAYTQAGSGMFKLAAEANLKLIYNNRKNAVYLRGFAGLVTYDLNGKYTYYTHTTSTHQSDYFYEDSYIKRGSNEGFFANQSYQREGGFYTNTMKYGMPLGMSDNYLMALNMNVDIPKTPLQVFGNIAYDGNDGKGLYEAGFIFKATPYLSVAFPLLVSEDIRDYQNYILGKNKFAKSISFRFNLTDFNASRFIQKKLMGIRM